MYVVGVPPVPLEGALTVTVQLADLVGSPTEAAVIVAVPAATAVILPLLSTVATASSLDFHVTFL